MIKTLLLLSLLLSLGSCNFYENFGMIQANISSTSVTNNYLDYEDPGTCECDLTSNTCDAYCCCDWDCSSLKDTWEAAGLCRDEAQELALPLNDCISSSQVRQYNIEKGEYSYAGPLTRLFCIYYNNYPPVNTFYELKDEVTNDEANDIDTEEVTFGTKLFATSAVETNNYYSIGDPLYAQYQDSTDNTVTTSQRYFRLPKPNTSGICDFNKPALFLENEDVECVAFLNLNNDTACLGENFNPKYYIDPTMKLLSDPTSSTSTVTVSTDIAKNYLIAADGTYAVNGGSTSAYSAGTPNTCSGHVKEVYYTFKYEARDDGFLIPNAVEAQLIMQTSTDRDGAAAPVHMKFKTFYELSTATDTIVYESGNPGYLDLYPLFVGTVDASGAIALNKDGFRVPVSAGACIDTTANLLTTNADNVLRFNQNLTSQCYVQGTDNTAAQFEAACTSVTSTLAIYGHLDSFARVGRYGNANYHYPSDWLTPIEQDMTISGTFNSTDQSCTYTSAVQVQILTSKVGFPNNQHAYIVSTRKKGIQSKIYYSDYKANSKIDLKVSYEYVRVTEREASTDAYVLKVAFEWPSDILWPFGTLAGAFGTSTMSIVSLLGATAAINLIFA